MVVASGGYSRLHNRLRLRNSQQTSPCRSKRDWYDYVMLAIGIGGLLLVALGLR